MAVNYLVVPSLNAWLGTGQSRPENDIRAVHVLQQAQRDLFTLFHFNTSCSHHFSRKFLVHLNLPYMTIA
jgi:hypothetical protein